MSFRKCNIWEEFVFRKIFSILVGGEHRGMDESCSPYLLLRFAKSLPVLLVEFATYLKGPW